MNRLRGRSVPTIGGHMRPIVPLTSRLEVQLLAEASPPQELDVWAELGQFRGAHQ